MTMQPRTPDSSAMSAAPTSTSVHDPAGAGGSRVMRLDPATLEAVAVADADAAVLLTEWNEFRALDLGKLARKMAHPRMADLRNIYGREEAAAAGFEHYEGVGR